MNTLKLERVGRSAYRTGRFHIERMRSGRWWIIGALRRDVPQAFKSLKEARSYLVRVLGAEE